MKEYENHALRILRELGVKEPSIRKSYVVNVIETESCPLDDALIRASISVFSKESCRVDIDIRLPEGGAVAGTFMEYCAALEKTPKNNHGEYCHGPRYRDQQAENRFKQTFAYNGSGWDHFFYIRSEHYSTDEIDEAVANAIALAKQFTTHLCEYGSLRYWSPEDDEVRAKAKEIIRNADLHETDIDREDHSHMLEDRNSFIRGWFYPFNDRGRGTFDTVWPSSVDYAACNMGRKGSFEYAVACLVLTDPEYIAKARKACVIRTETRTVQY